MFCLQNVLIGMDMRTYENRRMTGEYDISDSISIDEIAFDDEYFEVTIWILCWFDNLKVKTTKLEVKTKKNAKSIVF